MSTPIAYLNGRYLPIADANLHVFDLGIVGGTSVTEMVRTFRHIPFRLDQHLVRLARSLEYVGFETGLAMTDLTQICDHVIQVNSKLVPPWQDLGLVIFVTAGQNLTYVGRTLHDNSCTVCVHTFPLPFELWADSYRVGLHLVTVKTRNIPDDTIDPKVKHRSRLHWHLAAREARRIDPVAMAILRDHEGHLTETATGNLCVVDGNTIITPAQHVLEGISREYLGELARSLGITFVHGNITADDLAQADEAFLTSTPHCLLPVTRFNQAPIGSGQPGPVSLKLISAWGDAVGVDIIQQMQNGRTT